MDESPNPRIIFPAIIVSLVLFAGVFWAFQSAKNRLGTVVLPGGITYLGPSISPTLAPQPAMTGGKIPVPLDVKWIERKGQTLPFSFMIPDALNLGFFPNDPYDSVTIFYQGTDANANIFFRVEDLNKLNKKAYIGKPMEYVENWWKDYTWKGVATVTAFTNSQGLKGYRAKYIDQQGNTPFDHVFFEVPDKPNLMIWISGKLFTQDIFDRIVDSVTWKATP